MFLSYFFVGLFVIALLFAIGRSLLLGDVEVFGLMSTALFDSSRNAFEIALGLVGVLCFWMGLMKVAERSGLLQRLSQRLSPVLCALFPSIPSGDPALGGIFMNVSANLLGLDNAATPLGLETMKQLDRLNSKKEEASDAMIMFLALNASGLTLIPSGIMAYRLQARAANPADVFLPIFLATLVSTLVAVGLVGVRQRINFLKGPLLKLWVGILLFVGLFLSLWHLLPTEQFSMVSSVLSSLLLLGIVITFLLSGVRARINVYNAFVEGAKGGFSTAIGIVPYLVALLVGVGLLRASGAMELLIEGLRALVEFLHIDSSWVEGLPTMLMKPLSGSGARAMMVDAMHTYGADSLAGRLASVAQGSTDTTLYVVSLYYGAIGIKRMRYTVKYSLLADLAGALAAILFTYLFFA